MFVGQLKSKSIKQAVSDLTEKTLILAILKSLTSTQKKLFLKFIDGNDFTQAQKLLDKAAVNKEFDQIIKKRLFNINEGLNK